MTTPSRTLHAVYADAGLVSVHVTAEQALKAAATVAETLRCRVDVVEFVEARRSVALVGPAADAGGRRT
jgi:hypothetical protein